MQLLVLQVRSQCLATITKILHFGTQADLGEQLNDLPISSFIAGLLAQKDSAVAAKAMQLAEILMHKLPKVFSKYFLKEGVVHAVEQLAATAPKPAAEEKEKAKGKAAKRASQRLKVCHYHRESSRWWALVTVECFARHWFCNRPDSICSAEL